LIVGNYCLSFQNAHTARDSIQKKNFSKGQKFWNVNQGKSLNLGCWHRFYGFTGKFLHHQILSKKEKYLKGNGYFRGKIGEENLRKKIEVIGISERKGGYLSGNIPFGINLKVLSFQ
jgi:hypothetical protein